MADPATQSPYISSSSSSAAGHPEPGVPHPPPGARDCKGAGSPSCADSLVSCSQPVPLFAASQAGAAPPCGALPEAPAAKGSPGTASPGGSGPENGQPAARAAFTLPPAGDADADAAAKEKESPESPFELILDRAAFDREYKESLLDAGTGAAGWAARGELLAKIPEDGVCDFRAPPRAAGTAGTAGISRQASGTAAALEEVSKCVREMHSFTSELLHWDLAEQAERSGGSADEPGTAAVRVPSAPAASERPPPPPPPPPAAAPKADAGWPAPADDADSSGESDDTVIEDAPVPPREAREPPAAGPGSGNGSGSDVDPVAQEKPAGASPLPKGPAEERERPDGGSGGGGESFVAFMRECLNPGGRERPGNPAPAPRRGDGSAEPAPGSPAAAGHLEQEQQTIRALRELGEEPRGQSPAPVPAPPCVPWPPEPAPGSGRRDGTAASPAERALAELLAALSARDLVSWRDVRKTGLVFGTTLLLLLSLAAFSVISVVSYLVLALLSVTISFRVYKSVVQAVQKSEEGHPFKAYLDLDIALSSEAFHNYVNAAMVHVNQALRLVIRLFLVEDLVDSLKLAVVMWLMTYVGAVFNGITLLILGELLVFTLPLVYEKYKTQIDHYVGIARDQSKALVEKIQAKLPGLAKKKPE